MGVPARIIWFKLGGSYIRVPWVVLTVNTILSPPDENCAAETNEQNYDAEQIEG